MQVIKIYNNNCKFVQYFFSTDRRGMFPRILFSYDGFGSIVRVVLCCFINKLYLKLFLDYKLSHEKHRLQFLKSFKFDVIETLSAFQNSSLLSIHSQKNDLPLLHFQKSKKYAKLYLHCTIEPFMIFLNFESLKFFFSIFL